MMEAIETTETPGIACPIYWSCAEHGDCPHPEHCWCEGTGVWPECLVDWMHG